MTDQPASWVIRHRESYRAIYETFSEAEATQIKKNLRDDYEIVPILDHLQSINARYKEAAK